MTTDYWLGRARNIVQKYTDTLLRLALQKAQDDAETYAKKAEEAKVRATEIAEELNQ